MEIQTTRRFHWVDYVIFVFSLAVSAGIGVYYAVRNKRGKHDTTEAFLMGERKLKIVPVALSTTASFLSAISLLGEPAEFYYFGSTFCLIIFGYLLTLPLAAHVFVPFFRKLHLVSAYEVC
jgi:Na+/proline symporter